MSRRKRKAKEEGRTSASSREQAGPAPRAVCAEPLTLGTGPDASNPAGRMIFIQQLLPGVSDYVDAMAREGFDRRDWVIALIDPRREDMRRELEQRAGGSALVARVLMELADNRPAACIFAIHQNDFLRWLRATAPKHAIELHEASLEDDQFYFAAFFKEHISHGMMRLPPPRSSPFLA